jgi:hypothetical protein
MGKKTAKSPAPSAAPAPRSLVVVVADKDAEFTIHGLLSRCRSLNIRQLRPDQDYKLFVFSGHDAGCRVRAHDFLRSLQRQYTRALVLFDQEGCGQEDCPPEQLEGEIEDRLAKAGWKGRSAVVVLQPELEIWVWSRSPHVATVLGWQNQDVSLEDWLSQNSFWLPDQLKPPRPKEAMLAVLKAVRKPPSASLFQKLAEKVSLTHCKDRAFHKLLTTLQAWFPETTP